MSKPAAGNFRYYVAPQKNGDAGDGTPQRPLGSVRAALDDIARRHGGAAPSVKKLSGYDRVEICALGQRGANGAAAARPAMSSSSIRWVAPTAWAPAARSFPGPTWKPRYWAWPSSTSGARFRWRRANT